MNSNVLIFGVVSLLTDVSSEMIYPLLPAFLTASLGAGPIFLGVIEGIAESTAAFLKLVSGAWSDRVRDRSRLVLAGYTLSSLARPMVAAATSWHAVLVVRFVDRFGKGIRTSPRDAIVADSVDPSVHGKAFGFQRSMDHVGAVIGPLLAAALLKWVVSDLRTVFWLAAIPGVMAVVLVLIGVKEVRLRPIAAAVGHPFTLHWPHRTLRTYLAILFLFTLGNSSDAFLLLRAGQLGVPAAGLPLIWVVLHLVKAGTTMPFGALSDTFGRRKMLIAGWIIYAVTYGGFALAHQNWHAWALFALYGVFYGLTEGVERALLADLSLPSERGESFGWYNAIVGIAVLPASLIFGTLWQVAGPPVAFSFGAVLATISVGLLAFCVRWKKPMATDSTIAAV